MDPVEKNAMAYVERSRGIPHEERPDAAPAFEQEGGAAPGSTPSGRSTGFLGNAFRAVKDKIVGNG